MNSKPSLLVIHKTQFGYHTGNREMAKALRENYNITILCFDTNQKKYCFDGIEVRYIEYKGSYLIKGVRYLLACLKEIRSGYDLVFLNFFFGCFLLSIFSKSNIILDFRTASVNKKKMVRCRADFAARLEARFFPHVTVISEGVRDILKIPIHKSSILPLGSNILSEGNKEFKSPSLFYIGSISNRNINQTIEGLAVFLNENRQYRDVLRYHIVGTAQKNEIRDLEELVFSLGLERNVSFHGKMTHDEANLFFDNCNIGVSYVPITDYYNYQPPTKTYEYILSGMACLATATSENIKCINSKNGVLVNDTAEDFAVGLKKLIINFESFNSDDIRSTLIDHTWEKISQDFNRVLQKQMEIS